MIAAAIKDQLGVEVDRKRVERTAAIKQAGIHEVNVNLYREIGATLTVTVGDPSLFAPEAAEAEVEETAEEAVEAPETEETAE